MTNPPERWPPRTVAFRLGLAVVCLVALHIVAMQIIFNPAIPLAEDLGLEYWHLSVFDLDEEESFGTWFSAGILLLGGQLLWREGKRAREAGATLAMGWLVLGAAFHFLSIDEVVALHELLNTLMGDTSWTIVGIAVLAGLALGYLPFLWHHRGPTAALLILAGAIYGGGAVGIERYSGDEVNSLSYNMSTALEEGMEMTGVVVLIYLLLRLRETRRRDDTVPTP